MRKTRHILSLVLAVLIFVACTQDETGTLPNGKQPLTLTATIAGGANTRATVDNNWAGGEQIALQVDAGQCYTYTTDQNGRMTGNYYWPDNVQSIYIQGFCPSGKIKGGELCSVEKDQSIAENYQNSDLLCSNLQNINKESSYNALTFYHQTAKLIVNVTNNDYLSEEANSDVSMTINGLYTSATFASPTTQTSTIWAGEWTNHSNQGTIAPHKAATANGCAATFEALVIPQTVSTGILFQFYVGDVGPFRYTVPAGGITWNAGMEYTYNVTLKAENQTVTVNSISAGGWGNGGNHNLETE